MKITRTVKLALFANPGKLETLRYSYERYKLYTQHFITQLYHKPYLNSLSTLGMGQLANQAQHKAQGLLKAHRESVKETGAKSNLPVIGQVGCPGRIAKSEDTGFDYWVSVEDQFSKKRIHLPVKSHKRLSHWLAKGWTIGESCEIHRDRNGKFYVIVFVQSEIAKATPVTEFLGCDVGITHSTSRSDGHLGKGAWATIKKHRLKNAERSRQGHKTISTKSTFKQLLDREVRHAVHVAKATGLGLAVENPKILGNLRSGKLQGWAKVYFASRARIVCQEEGVFYWEVNPAYSSQTCSKCGHCDKRSRVKSVFDCTACESRTHADINASRVIAQRGSDSVRINLFKQSGSVKNKRSKSARTADKV